MKQIIFTKRAEKFLEKLDKSDKNLSYEMALELKVLRVDPLNSKVKKIVRSDSLYRVRVGKYRIIYRFDSELIHILNIAKREDVYDFLKN